MSESGVLQRNQAQRTERIITAAMELAREGGYDAVQMRALADRSGVAVGTIYRYFGSKDEVLLDGMAGWLRLLDGRIRSRGFPEGTVADRVVGEIRAAMGSCGEHHAAHEGGHAGHAGGAILEVDADVGAARGNDADQLAADGVVQPRAHHNSANARFGLELVNDLVRRDGQYGFGVPDSRVRAGDHLFAIVAQDLVQLLVLA